MGILKKIDDEGVNLENQPPEYTINIHAHTYIKCVIVIVYAILLSVPCS